MSETDLDIPDIISGTNSVKIPPEILSTPSLLFLYHRIEQILGINAGHEALKKLDEHIEKNHGFSFLENPASYEDILNSREQIFNLSKFITVNETYFFRESVHFKLLADILPELVKKKHHIYVCSAACSTGCEAYSIAMLLDYYAKSGLDFDFTVDAFDVNSEAIEAAKNAGYTSNTLRHDGSEWKTVLDLYLTETDGDYTVSQDIKRKTKFFAHNIMHSVDRQYDIIFFRNALIYFTPKNRFFIIKNIAEALADNGYLFLGVSETSSVKHPLLANRYSSDAFYYQKTQDVLSQTDLKYNDLNSVNGKEDNSNNLKSANKKNYDSNKNTQLKPVPKEIFMPKQAELSINCSEITSILKIEEGKPNAENVLKLLEGKNDPAVSGSSLAASVLYYINKYDFDKADLILSHLEKHNTGIYTRFLRGEVCFHSGNNKDAEKYYQEAAEREKMFWPAFYRISILASEGNQTRYKYRINKTIESIELAQNHKHGKNHDFECFMGNFSSDYFIRILEKKLA